MRNLLFKVHTNALHPTLIYDDGTYEIEGVLHHHILRWYRKSNLLYGYSDENGIFCKHYRLSEEAQNAYREWLSGQIREVIHV